MSVRLLTIRIIKHGKNILHSYWRRTHQNRDIHTNILEQNQTRQHLAVPRSSSNALTPNNSSKIQIAQNLLQTNVNSNVGATAQSAARSSGIFRFGQHARKIFIDNLLNRVTTTYSQELRQQAMRKLFYGDSAPFFALVGVSLASGAGVLTKDDELEGVCLEIREAASRLQATWSYDEISETLDTQFNVDKLDIGPPIATGCAAVVYAASLKFQSDINSTKLKDHIVEGEIEAVPKCGGGINPCSTKQYSAYGPELLSPMQNMSRFVHNFGGSVDNLNVYNQSVAAANLAAELAAQQRERLQLSQEQSLQDNDDISNEANPIDRTKSLHGLEDNNISNIQRYPLALKMMFNYDIQSNASCILRAMYKEIVPARQRLQEVGKHSGGEATWEGLLRESTSELPPHPNIVCMYGYFVDEVRALPEGNHLYPVAQPPRINPNGYGRNMSLYLLMKRYNYSLREMLDQQALSMRTKMLLFAQLLEAVAHLARHGIAHRDIKSDNLLIELTDEDAAAPLLVLTDFGCCLADSQHGLQLPYTSMDMDKGGNAALMAPEIINKKPGPFAVLNYAKADLWACGAIAYEIFGQRNPFYAVKPVSFAKGEPMPKSLHNSNYKQNELPNIIDSECPELVKELIYNILQPNPAKRISPDIAANIMQLLLWAPSQWLRPHDSASPNSPEILQWLLSLSSKVVCEGRADLSAHNYGHKGRRTYVEYLLLCSFLSRVRLRRVRGALNWIHQNVLQA